MNLPLKYKVVVRPSEYTNMGWGSDYNIVYSIYRIISFYRYIKKDFLPNSGKASFSTKESALEFVKNHLSSQDKLTNYLYKEKRDYQDYLIRKKESLKVVKIDLK